MRDREINGERRKVIERVRAGKREREKEETEIKKTKREREGKKESE